jgi:hypothetical protein
MLGLTKRQIDVDLLEQSITKFTDRYKMWMNVGRSSTSELSVLTSTIQIAECPAGLLMPWKWAESRPRCEAMPKRMARADRDVKK